MADHARTAPVTDRDAGSRELEPLLREVVGRRLRALRLARGERLVETAARAGISPQYLSEIERGLKEPSSEMIAAITGALATTLVDLTTDVARDLRGGLRAQEQRHPRTTETPTRSDEPAVLAAPPSAPPFALYAVAA
ncbi:helix-turn-helix domain-containing protein [Frondihabitans australicus]|uniref:Transcriptional regulator with XRE-family HTH domain n=1 Tax=Frondihabitans australicus TaxID=386892 RepID=A0A495IE50_9MICO|nr:helix-turn-helix transcriptional regulator [Frondihabitans australicus]RKR74059.1 transcriptional regulator with XRE-family HTH domain [Frondihabitans australicus]